MQQGYPIPATNPAIWQFLDSRDLGGIETHVLILASGLKDRGWQARVLFYADYGGHPLLPALAAAGVATAALDGQFRSLMAALRWGRPAILHTHGYRAGILGRLAGALLGIPTVSTFHSGEPGTGRLRWYFALDRWTARLAKIIAVSPQIAAGLGGRAVIIPNFVAIPPDTLLDQGPRTDIGFVGRLSPEKGPDLFLALARRFAEPDSPDWVVFGDGPMRATLEAEAGGCARFIGRVASMAPHWPSLGLLVISSRHEGLPLAALEAMAHGVPVAGFAVGGLPDLIQSGVNGFLVPPGDLDALAGVIRHWTRLDKAARRDLGHAAHIRVAESYSVTAGLDAVTALYRTLI